LKVLADETRLAVVETLVDGPATVTEINASLGVEATLLSHHLKALREANLVTRTRQGRYARYALAPALSARHDGRSIDLGCCTLSFS
jgi:ArsR family transcriptional regulator